MPIYTYHCKECGKTFDVSQSFSDEPLTECPSCHKAGSLGKVYSDVAVIYHGSGYYCTDHAHDHSHCENCAHKQ